MVYLGYMFLLIGFGSLINLKFFRLTDYGFTIVFFILWGNTLVASAFLVSHSVAVAKPSFVRALINYSDDCCPRISWKREQPGLGKNPGIYIFRTVDKFSPPVLDMPLWNYALICIQA